MNFSGKKQQTIQQSLERFMLLLWVMTIAMTILLSNVQAEENTRSTSQPLVGGPTVDQQTRRELGLLTLTAPGPALAAPGALFPGPPTTKSCSAALLNDYWAITASHCINAVTSPDQIRLRADWSVNQTRQASDVHSFQWTHNLDIAIVMIDSPFPRHPSVVYPQLSYRPTTDLQGQRIELFGRGISTLAWQAGTTPIPSASDGLFRTSDFEVFQTSADGFTYRSIEGAGRAIAGGDSGGPSYFRVWDDHTSPDRQIVRLLAGVHSNCQTQCLPGQTCGSPSPWTWVTNIPQCSDASVERILRELQTRIAFVPQKPYDEKPIGDMDVLIPPDKGIVAKPSEATKQAVVLQNDSAVAKPRDNVKMFATATTTAFTGNWATVTGTLSYTMTLTQNGEAVSGSYSIAGGSATGVISGTVSDRTLVYRWTEGSQTGTGKFTLSQDGATFQGWWNSGADPNVVQSNWSGTRK